MTPKSRKEANQIGARHYYTGIKCRHGHLELRLTSTGACMQCMRDRQKARMTDPAYREIHRKSCRERMRKLLAEPSTRARIREREREAYAASIDRKNRKAEGDRVRNQSAAAKERRRERERKRYSTVLRNDLEYIANRKARGAKWAIDNRDKTNAKTAARRAMRKQCAPRWLTAEMLAKVEGFYNLARKITEESGIQHEVDHIVPLKSDVVCGLHVPWNLQVISATQNRAKSNRLGV